MAEDEAPPAEPIDPVTSEAPAVARSRVGWLSAVLLVTVVLLGVLLAVEWIHADAATIADEGWQTNAQWAAALGVVLLGAALAVMAWTLAAGPRDPVLARVAVVIAAVGVVGAVVVIGVADDRGGQLARSSTPPVQTSASPAGDEGTTPDEPLRLADALEPENLTSVAIPIEERTYVQLELTGAGRRFVAGAMGCRASDLEGRPVSGVAIGGTWVQPLVVVNPPANAQGQVIARCRRTTVRLPQAAGIAGSGL